MRSRRLLFHVDRRRAASASADRRVVRDARGFANHTGSDDNAELYERDLDTDEPNTTGWPPPPQERRDWRRREIDGA
ncbi:hypothetical protein WL40_11630 [Burkholderia ubonensis]|nr:hypothetical protein WJ85_20910 [Burkholderia ubonensis]KVP55136.1 hypothetical protein WJ92_15285 [Burkholderia ubonensis]KWB71383.1 hypothetical protein WL40_11630 [Burkholderia ubonensis]KWQ02411.1 hypothetical protein WM34_25860 [Burkholderia ubonensis]